MSKLNELRLKIRDKLYFESGNIDPRDLARAHDDKYLTRILEHCDGNTDDGVKMLLSIMKWRRENKANDVKDLVNIDLLNKGLFFPHGRDLDGFLVFILKWKLYKKGEVGIEDLKRLVVYWLERMEREEGGKPVTLFFDVDGCGISNVEVDIVVYMINLLKSYYPVFVNQIIIYQMPWIMNAGFRLMKGLLPAEAVERLRVISKEKLGDYIHPDQALECWGGNSAYSYRYTPERTVKKHVTFADRLDVTKGDIEIMPKDCLTFIPEGELKTRLVVANSGDGNAAFKIRTTGPEKFRVKPSSGILAPNSRLEVGISVLPGFDVNSAISERFLVLATSVQDDDTVLEEIFKNSKDRREFRLKCKLSEPVVKPVADTFEELKVKHLNITKSLDLLKMLQMATLGLTALGVTYSCLIYGTVRGYC